MGRETSMLQFFFFNFHEVLYTCYSRQCSHVHSSSKEMQPVTFPNQFVPGDHGPASCRSSLIMVIIGLKKRLQTAL